MLKIGGVGHFIAPRCSLSAWTSDMHLIRPIHQCHGMKLQLWKYVLCNAHFCRCACAMCSVRWYTEYVLVLMLPQGIHTYWPTWPCGEDYPPHGVVHVSHKVYSGTIIHLIRVPISSDMLWTKTRISVPWTIANLMLTAICLPLTRRWIMDNRNDWTRRIESKQTGLKKKKKALNDAISSGPCSAGGTSGDTNKETRDWWEWQVSRRLQESVPSAPSVRHETLQIKPEDHAKKLWQGGWQWLVWEAKTPLLSRGLATMGQTKLISGVVLFGFFDVSYGERNWPVAELKGFFWG